MIITLISENIFKV